MGKYVLHRLGQLVLVLAGISVLTFGLMALVPGDQAQAILGSYATPANLERLRHEMHLDESLVNQYIAWMQGVLTGDLGHSYSMDRSVTDVVFGRLGATLLLAAAALMICVGIGLCSGLIASVWRGRWPDRLMTTIALLGLSTPMFWLAMVLVLVFSVSLGWLPSGGMTSPYETGVADRVKHLILPAVALGLVASGVIARVTRSSMLEVLGEDYLRTARSKGLGERRVILKHAFKNGLVSIVPVIGVQIGFLLGGAVYIETIFSWPGIGSMLVNAIQTRDLLLVQGGVLVVAVLYVLINLGADLIQALLDPRVRAQ